MSISIRRVYNRVKNSKTNEKQATELNYLKTLASRVGGGVELSKIFDNLPHSKSEIKQDIFVLTALNFKSKGYFVDFGATDGVSCSNTYLLEKKFNWNGIVVEPVKSWHDDLRKNRNVHVDFDCVWQSSNEQVDFWEFRNRNRALSGVSSGLRARIKKRFDKQKKVYSVNTVSLNDLLERYNAPRTIDYLSIDTEGTELEIIRNFDFNTYKFSVITIEHNYTSDREKQHELLASNGYKRVMKNVSQFDDWYVLR